MATLVLTGRDDRVIPPANSYLLAHRIPHARLHVIPDAGHGFFWEKVSEVVDLLCQFCDLEFHETNIYDDPA